MYRALFLLAAAACLPALIGCQKGDNARAKGAPIQVAVALPDMAAFDRAYIPVLVLTETDDAERAKAAMKLLLLRWEELHGKYIAAPTLTPQWRADFDSIDRMIRTADGWLHDGKPPR